MFYNEHNPPHFHAYYNDFQAEISIETLEIIKGNLPNKVYNLVIEWAILHQKELLSDWELLRNDTQPKKTKPLV